MPIFPRSSMTSRSSSLLAVLFVLVLTCDPQSLVAQGADVALKDGKADRARSGDLHLPEDAVTQATVSLRNGHRVSYTAHAGILAVGGTDGEDLQISAPDELTGVMQQSDDSAIAAMSYVAYFADQGDRHQRPILFLYDGGPSVSTRTMLVASFGPIAANLPGLHHPALTASAIT